MGLQTQLLDLFGDEGGLEARDAFFPFHVLPMERSWALERLVEEVVVLGLLLLLLSLYVLIFLI